MYPHEFYFHFFANRILSFNGEVSPDDLLAQNPCVLFKGGDFNFDYGPYDVQLLEKGRLESIYILRKF